MTICSSHHEFDLLIKNGTVIFQKQGRTENANIAIKDGVIAAFCSHTPSAEQVIDAEGLHVSPGFVDTHMHDEEANNVTVEETLLRQGVTTAIAGNCGLGPLACNIEPYRQNPWLNLGYLTGHTCLREAVGIKDCYAAADFSQIEKMKELLRVELENGSFGLSIGLEYMPNTPPSEIEPLFDVVKNFSNVWVPVHIRYDGPKAVEAVDEIIGYAKKWPIRFQISHTGSMTGFGQLGTVLSHIDEAKKAGADITFDCYPYDAFCTHLGSAVFDAGFEERWGLGAESLEIASGEHRGRWLNEDDLYIRLRKEAPETLIVAHVIRQDEVELCLSHHDCAVASDSLLKGGHGHPRAAGTFPRAIRMLLDKGHHLTDVIHKCTSLPASMAYLDAGVLAEDNPADIVIFDKDKIKDNATFRDELLPPSGIEYVLLSGQIAVQKNEIIGKPKGRLIRRR